MKEGYRFSFDEAKRQWQEQSGQGRKLTRAWLRAAIPCAIGAKGRPERCEFQLALGVGLSATISALVFLYGSALYQAQWHNQMDFVALSKSFITVDPFETKQ